jgi:hypothetical protein
VKASAKHKPNFTKGIVAAAKNLAGNLGKASPSPRTQLATTLSKQGSISETCITTFAPFVWTYQQNQQLSSSVFLSQQTSEQCF